MTIHRMRTINESVAIIKEMDEQSAITANCIRTLCKEGKVHCVFTGKKILVDLDALIAFLSGNYQKTAWLLQTFVASFVVAKGLL